MSEGAVPGPSRVVPARAALPSVLVGIRVVVLAVILIAAGRGHVTDPVVLRVQRVATSPAAPYRAFPVGTMPLETAVNRVIGAGGAGAVMAKIAILAFLADLAAAWAVRWGWGRRPSIVYLLVGLPLLSFMYLRFDLVSVALAAWAIAWSRHDGEGLGGATLGVATMSKVWPIILLPAIWLRRNRRPALVGFASVVVVLGAWWYLVGGPKGPFQVLTFQGARGWDVQSTIGSVLWSLGRGTPVPEFDVLRIGDAATWARAVLFVGLVLCEIAIWRRAARDRGDAAGGAALTAVAATLVFAPQLSPQYALWLLPWTALAFEGDEVDQRSATIAAIAIALTALIAVGWTGQPSAPSSWVKLAVAARNLAAIGILVSSFAGRSTRITEPSAAAAT